MAPDLKRLHDERSNNPEFKERNVAYKVTEAYYLSKKPGADRQELTYRRYLVDNVDTGGSNNPEALKMMVNLVSQIVNHHAAAFSRTPKVWNVPRSSEQSDLNLADRLTRFLRWVMNRSRIKLLQPRQAHWLSLRGDAIYGVDWNQETHDIIVRTFDPAWCYPSFDELDPGGMDDLLIAFTTDPRWVEEHLGHSPQTNQKTVPVYIYWTSSERDVQVGDTALPQHHLQHDLGFVPYRWAFGRPSNKLAQSDVRDIPKIQDLFNENVQMAMDAAAKQVDPAYWGRGITGDIIPRPGEVVALPGDNAVIDKFPTSEPPAVITEILHMLQTYAQSMAGISPISMEGVAPGSIVTGAAVRHQVEAMESRNEVKRVVLEDTFAMLGEYILKLAEKKFHDHSFSIRDKTGNLEVSGSDVDGWYECMAEYGGYYEMDPQNRLRTALEGLGRIWDEREAVKIADVPGVDPDEMARRLEDYQLRQARITAQAQVVGEQVMQEQQQGSPAAPPSGQGLQAPQQLPAPSPADFMVSLSKVESLLTLVKNRLKGSVWAVGDLAISGQSNMPQLMAQDEEDAARLQGVAQQIHGLVLTGSPNGDPKVKLV